VKRKWIIPLTIGVAVLVGVLLMRGWPQPGATSAPPVSKALPILDQPSGAAVALPAVSGSSAPESDSERRRRFRDRIGASRDYFELIRHWLPAARAGDPEAEYSLFKALAYCQTSYRAFFTRRGESLTLSEGLQYATRRHLSLDIAQEVYDRCHALTPDAMAEFGNPAQWLDQSAAAGQPVAQAQIATQALLQKFLARSAAESGGSNPNEVDARLQNTDVSNLLNGALRSLDPDALFIIGEYYGIIAPGDADADINGPAWILVACQRGADCSSTSEWVKSACVYDPQCMSFVGYADRLRNMTGDDAWPAVQLRALELNEMLDAGRWDELGIGQPSAERP